MTQTPTRSLGRLSEIAQAMARHGFGYFLEAHKLTDLLPGRWSEGRVVDRSRQLAIEIKGLAAGDELRELRVRQIGRLRQRAQLLIRAQSVIYAALGLFVMTALVSVIGSALALGYPGSYRATAVIGLVVGVAATGGLMHGCVLLVRETRLALVTLREDVALSEAPVEKIGKNDAVQ